MKNIAIVNIMEITPYFYEKIGGNSQLELIKKFALSLPHVDEIVFYGKKEIDGIEKFITDEICTEKSLIENLLKICKGYDNLFYFYGDCPLLDINLANEMYKDHLEYYAEYTFADGYPYGLTTEIIDCDIIPALKILTEESIRKINRSTLFEIIKKDINSFELETKIAEKDLRLFRISLTSDSKRNFNLLNRIYALGGYEYRSITDIILNHQEILFVEPSFITIEITKRKNQKTTYLPERKVDLTDMDISTLDKILEKIKNYSEDAVISFVPEYEPALHPQILQVIDCITRKYGFKLFMETSGVGWSQDFLDKISDNDNLNIIITLDAINIDLYKEIRGDGYAEAISFAKKSTEIIHNRVWIQGTRMTINEVDMEPFYRYWQKFTNQIIIQKYSDYNQSLKNLKVADLSPLKRFPCWHLKRDLHINTEGFALICFNDINSKYPLGSMINTDINIIMEKKLKYYKDHIDCKYSDFCRKCDEYYTFNF